MTSFGQWWRRTTRSGHAAAEGAALHGAPPERHNVSQTWRAVAWGAALPLLSLVLALFNPLWLLLWLLYPLQVLRLSLRGGIGNSAVRLRSLFLVLGRFPEAIGVFKFWLNRWLRRRTSLIEYK